MKLHRSIKIIMLLILSTHPIQIHAICILLHPTVVLTGHANGMIWYWMAYPTNWFVSIEKNAVTWLIVPLDYDKPNPWSVYIWRGREVGEREIILCIAFDKLRAVDKAMIAISQWPNTLGHCINVSSCCSSAIMTFDIIYCWGFYGACELAGALPHAFE